MEVEPKWMRLKSISLASMRGVLGVCGDGTSHFVKCQQTAMPVIRWIHHARSYLDFNHKLRAKCLHLIPLQIACVFARKQNGVILFCTVVCALTSEIGSTSKIEKNSKYWNSLTMNGQRTVISRIQIHIHIIQLWYTTVCASCSHSIKILIMGKVDVGNTGTVFWASNGTMFVKSANKLV